VPTPSLRELQGAFWRSIAREPGDASPPDPVLLETVPATPMLAPAARVQVYATMYFWRLVETLREDFSKVAAALGEEGFPALMREYLARHPSTEPSIRHLGRALPDFLAGREPAYLADLARLEWARLEVFDAPDATPLGVADLRRVAPKDWPGLRFTLVPACTRLVTTWAVHRLWADGPALVVPGRTALRVWRESFRVYQTAMAPAEEAALAHLLAGEPFASICEAFDDPAEAGGLLLRWVEDGIIAGA
jgi:hypothetical protein